MSIPAPNAARLLHVSTMFIFIINTRKQQDPFHIEMGVPNARFATVIAVAGIMRASVTSHRVRCRGIFQFDFQVGKCSSIADAKGRYCLF